MSDSARAFDMAVCGTGPAGMISALYAAHHGLSVALVGPSVALDDRRTTALLAPSLDVLEQLGLHDAVEAIGTPLNIMRLLDGSRRLVRTPAVSFDAEEIGRASFGLNCPNAKLNAVLAQTVSAHQGITPLEGLVVNYALGASPLRLTLSDGQIIQAKAVLAADGRNSSAREAAGIAVRRWSYPQTAAVGVVRHAKPHGFVSTEFHTETGPFTFVPMPDAADGAHQSSFVCVLAPEDAQALRAMTLEDASLFLEKRAQHLFGRLDLIEAPQLWPLEGLVAYAFAARGVYLIGEASHAFPPIGAQGLNLSVRDGVDAVDVVRDALAKGEDPATRLLAVRFSAKRRADVWARTFGVDALNRSLLSHNPLMQVGRMLAMSAANVSPGLKRGLMVAGLEPFSLRGMVSSMMDALRRAA